jgi:hypothetical protein
LQPEKATSLSSFDDSEVSSAFSLYLNLVTHQLYQVHLFLQQSYDATSAVDRARWQSQCIAVDEALNKWQSINLKTNYLGHDSTMVLSAVTFNTWVLPLLDILVFLTWIVQLLLYIRDWLCLRKVSLKFMAHGIMPYKGVWVHVTKWARSYVLSATPISKIWAHIWFFAYSLQQDSI